MNTYGLIGFPLGHSFSAAFFAEKFRREGICATYRNFEMPDASGLRELVENTPSLCGLNVTIPHKQSVMPLLDEVSPEASRIGAVNVIAISRAGGKTYLKGYNSDVIGFQNSIAPLINPELHKQALVLGTGGASKAVIHALRSMGIAPTYVSRTKREGQLTYSDLTPEVMQAHGVIVNCTPVGMSPHVDECPDLPYQLLTPAHLLYDLIYNPLETLFLKRGRERKASTKNGLEMLHLQAIAAWEFWTGKRH